jgi:hypothetical protein
MHLAFKTDIPNPWNPPTFQGLDTPGRIFVRNFDDVDADKIPSDRRVFIWEAWDPWDWSVNDFVNKGYRCIGPSHMGGGNDSKVYSSDDAGNSYQVLVPRIHKGGTTFGFWNGNAEWIPDLGSADAYQRPGDLKNNGRLRFADGNCE